MLARIRKSAEEKDQGFTLIELLVVIIIIGILAAIAIPTFLKQREKGYKADMKSAMKNMATALESAATETGGSYAGFTLATATGEGFKYSSTLSPSVVSVTTARYCLTVTDTRIPGTPYYYDSNLGVPSETACV